MSKIFTIVQIVTLDGTGDSAYRMEWPAKWLAKKDKLLKVINVSANHPDRYKIAKDANLLVLFNCADIDFLTVIHERKKLGLKTLVEINDNFYEPQPWSPVAKEWSSWQIWQTYELFMQVADGVVVTGLKLKELLQSKTSTPIYVIENLLNQCPDRLEVMLDKKNNDFFGWAGSLGHIADILSVVPVINNILSKNTSYKFLVMGNDSLRKILRLPSSQFFYHPWGSVGDYYNFWQEISVGIIPLIDTPYNCCRSDIKVIEMASLGVIPIVPNLAPYHELIQNFGLFTYFNRESFFDSIQKALSLNYQQKLEHLLPIYEYIKKNRQEESNFNRLNLYRQFLVDLNFEADQPGYYYLDSQSSLVNNVPFIEELKQIQAVNKLGEPKKALATLTNLYESSPFHYEYAFSLLNQTVYVKLEASKLIEECIKKFKYDIRFRIKKISLAQQSVSTLWQELFLFLRNQPHIYQQSVRDLIKNYLIKVFNSEQFDQQYLEITEEFLLMFPFSYDLRFLLATAYEKLEKDKEAKGHYYAIWQAKTHIEQGLNTVSQFDTGYLSAWYQALDKRLS